MSWRDYDLGDRLEALAGAGRVDRSAATARFAAVLGIDPADRSWRRLAACRGCDPNRFYLGRGQDQRTEPASTLACRSCPVAAECLAAGAGEKIGTWGGVTAAGRRRLRAGLAAGVSPARLFAREAPVAWAARPGRGEDRRRIGGVA